jgi:hypothetical protein
MWENELIMFRFGFALLIAICILLLAILVRSYFDHGERINVLSRLATHSQCDDEEEREQNKKEEENEKDTV